MTISIFILGSAGCIGQEEEETTTTTPTTTPTTTTPVAKGEMVREVEYLHTAPEYDPLRFEMGKIIVEEWRKLGVRVKETPLLWISIQPQLQTSTYDAFIIHWIAKADRIDPYFMLWFLHHSSQTDPGENNFVGYINPEYDELADAMLQEYDTAKRLEFVLQCQEMLAKDVPGWPIVSRKEIALWNKDTFSNHVFMLGEGLNSFWNFMETTPETDRTELIWAYPTEMETPFNPLMSLSGHGDHLSRLLYDRLYRINPEGIPEPWAAESIDVIDDVTVDVILRQNMKFHDGVEVTAEDVKYTVDLIKETSAPLLIGRVTTVESVEVMDKYKARFNLNQPNAALLSNTFGYMYILPKHIWEEIPVDEALTWENPTPIGSGPFKFEYWNRGEEVKFVRFDGYWTMPEKPHITAILDRPMPMEVALRSLEDAEVDQVTGFIDPLAAEDLVQLDHIESAIVPTHSFYHQLINMRKAPFNDYAFRLALRHVVPKQKIIDVIFGPKYAMVSDAFISPDVAFWYNPNVQTYPYDVAKARQILEDAGYSWDDDGNLYYPPEPWTPTVFPTKALQGVLESHQNQQSTFGCYLSELRSLVSERFSKIKVF